MVEVLHTFDWRTYDYSFECRNDQFGLIMRPKEEAPHKVERTLTNITFALDEMERSGWALSQDGIRGMHSFMDNYETKIRATIWKKHCFLGWFYILIQLIFQSGSIGRLRSLKGRITPANRRTCDLVIQRLFITPERREEAPLPPSSQYFACFPSSSSSVTERPYELLRRALLALHETRVSTREELRLALTARLRGDSAQAHFLESLLRSPLDTQSVSLIVEALQGTDIAARYQQLKSRDFELENPQAEEKKLSPLSFLRLAFAIEQIFHEDWGQRNKFFKAEEHHIGRNIQYDGKHEEVFILSGPWSLLRRQGWFKEITTGLRVPKDRQAPTEVVAIASNLVDSSELTPEKVEDIRQKAESLKKEGRYFERLSDIPGIAPCYSGVEYSERIRGVRVSRFSVPMKLARSDLQDIIREGRWFSLAEQKSIARKLLGFSSRMHERGIIQADLKPDNILLYSDGTCGVADFGCAFFEKNPNANPYILNGFYGTYKFSSLELLRGQAQGNYRPLDCWALGCILYELYFLAAPPWIEQLDHFRLNTREDDREALVRELSRFEEDINRIVERPYAALCARQNLSEAERYEKMIFGLLRKDPLLRTSMQQALDQLN
jgi:hypothetical protein